MSGTNISRVHHLDQSISSQVAQDVNNNQFDSSKKFFQLSDWYHFFMSTLLRNGLTTILIAFSISSTLLAEAETILNEKTNLKQKNKTHNSTIEQIAKRNLDTLNRSILALDKKLKKNPADGEAYYNKGLAHHRYGKFCSRFFKTKSESTSHFKQALSNYNEASRLKFRDVQLYCYRSEILSYFGRYNDALRDINKSLKINPKSDWTLAQRGVLYTKLGKTQEALSDFQKAISLNPKQSDNFKKLGMLYLKLKQYEQAIKAFTKAIALNSQDVASLIQRGKCYKFTNKPALSENDFDRALSINPRSATAFKERGSLNLVDENFEQAIQDFYSELEIVSARQSKHHSTLSPKHVKDVFDNSLKNYRKILSIDPKNRMALFEAGIASFGLGKWKMATKYLNGFLDQGKLNQRSDCQAAALLAVAYRRLNDQKAATACIHRVYSRKKEDTLYSKIIDFMHGSLSKRMLARSANTKTARTIVRFYIALELLDRQRLEKAINRLNWIRSKGDPGTEEYGLAVCELSRLER